MQIIFQGLRITTKKHYIKFTKSKYFNVVEDDELDCMTVYFNELSSKFLVDKRIEVLRERVLSSTDYIKICNPTYKLDGLTFTKLTTRDYTFRQFIVEDIDSFIMSYNEYSCTVLIPKNKIYRLDLYKDILSKNIYLKILDMETLFDLHNFKSVYLRNYDYELKSDQDESCLHIKYLEINILTQNILVQI